MATRNRTSRTLVLGIGFGVVFVAAAVVWRLVVTPAPPAAVATPQEPAPDAGAAADRPEETVQALAGSVESLRNRFSDFVEDVGSGLDGVREELAAARRETASIRDEAVETEARESEKLDVLRDELLAGLQGRIDELEARLGADYPVSPPDAEPYRGELGADGLVWHAAAEPGVAAGGTAWAGLTEQFRSIPGSGTLGLEPADDGPAPPVPVWTIPSDATLVRARGLTALIGRVPIDGQVTDPMPFKVLVGPDNLLANGQTLPEIERAVFSGVAFGDATLHCVTGRVEQVTFVFADGSIATWPGDGAGGEPLGWISDERGYPCIPGEHVSNLGETVGRVATSSLAAGLARAWSENQVTTTRDGTAVSRSVTGDTGEYVFGQGLAAGLDEWSRIVAERAAQAFDAVVVEPGAVLTVHVDRSIPVDWPPEGRRIRHLASFAPQTGRTGGLD